MESRFPVFKPPTLMPATLERTHTAEETPRLQNASVSGEKAGRMLRLTFENGEKRVFDIGRFIARGGVFAAMKDYEVFSSFTVLPFGRGIEWECGAELSRDTLYLDSMYIGTVSRLDD